MPKKLDRCVKKVRKKRTGNPYAICWSAIKKNQLKIGTKIELEHTKSRKRAKEIALDHLAEHPLYYDYLIKMEAKMEKDLKKRRRKK